MRLHSNEHSWDSIHRALATQKGLGNVAHSVYIDKCEPHGSRSHDKAFEVHLACDEKVKGDKRFWTNSGNRGANSEANGTGTYAATYDEWGYFIAQLFDVDPQMKFGTYTDHDQFHRVTEYKYNDYLVEKP